MRHSHHHHSPSRPYTPLERVRLHSLFLGMVKSGFTLNFSYDVGTRKPECTKLYNGATLLAYPEIQLVISKFAKDINEILLEYIKNIEGLSENVNNPGYIEIQKKEQ